MAARVVPSCCGKAGRAYRKWSSSLLDSGTLQLAGSTARWVTIGRIDRVVGGVVEVLVVVE